MPGTDQAELFLSKFCILLREKIKGFLGGGGVLAVLSVSNPKSSRIHSHRDNFDFRFETEQPGNCNFSWTTWTLDLRI